jgi:hypothetical protein
VLGQGWQSHWARVHRRLGDVRAVYAGRQGGTDDAVDTVLSFFEAVHHLKDWLGNDQLRGVTKADGDSLIDRSKVLRLCADLANGSKHLVLTGSRTGDKSTTIARNDVNIFAGTGTVAHRFYVQSAGREYDVLEIAEAAVAEWAKFLAGQGPRVIRIAEATVTGWTKFLTDKETPLSAVLGNNRTASGVSGLRGRSSS